MSTRERAQGRQGKMTEDGERKEGMKVRNEMGSGPGWASKCRQGMTGEG
jgi:hypothetical protein